MQTWIGSLTTKLLLSAVVAVGFGMPLAAADPYTVLYRFQGKADGAYPGGGVAMDAQGNLYGTTVGNTESSCSSTIYKLTKPASGGSTWTHTVLHRPRASFARQCIPMGHLTLRGDHLYGTFQDGASGSVYRLNLQAGTGKILHPFDYTQGAYPPDGVVFGPDGTLYGTTISGGRHNCGISAQGVIYRLGPTGGFRVLHYFGQGTGAFPYASPVFGPDGAMYGTTSEVCADGHRTGNGVVYRITTDGSYTILHVFDPATEIGKFPDGRLVFGADGTLYGTTRYGFKDRQTTDASTVWSLKPGAAGETWTFKTIYEFDQSQGSGKYASGLVRDDAGNLYGLTEQGGAPHEDGVLYRLSPPVEGVKWSFTKLHGCKYGSDGHRPISDLILVDGTLYGTTALGGANNGTVFSYSLK